MATSISDYTLFILGQEFLHGAKHRIMFSTYQYLYSLMTPSVCHESSIRHAVRQLISTKSISTKLEDGIQFIQLTQDGMKQLEDKYSSLFSKKTSMTTPTSWIVAILDVAERQRKTRDEIRNKLLQVGFKQWKRAVYIYPNRKEDQTEIKEIARNMNWESYLQIFSTQEMIFGSDNSHIYEELFLTDSTSHSTLSLLENSNDITTQLSKRALNAYQKKSYFEKGQKTLNSLFVTIEGMAENNYVHTPTPPLEVFKEFKKLCASLETHSTLERSA